jgi:hypothetical protein
MKMTDRQLLQLLAKGTQLPESGSSDNLPSPELAEQLLGSVPTKKFTSAQLQSILAATGIAGLTQLAAPSFLGISQALWKHLGMATLGLGSVACLFLLTHRPKAIPDGMTRYDTSPPPPAFVSSPIPVLDLPNMEALPPSQSSFDAPPGLKNLAQTATLTASVPVSTELHRLTDGDKSTTSPINLGQGAQSVTLDLGSPQQLFTLVLWHRYDAVITYRDVLVELSDTADFAKSSIAFNNDHDNSLGRGIGRDHGYLETNYGRVLPLSGRTARYVRLWSNGNQLTDENHYAEVQVWGK